MSESPAQPDSPSEGAPDPSLGSAGSSSGGSPSSIEGRAARPKRRLGPFGLSMLLHAVLVLSIWGGIAFTYQRDRVRSVDVTFAPSDAVSSPIETMPRPDELAPDPPPETAEPDPDLSPDPEWREPGETAPEGRVWIGPRSVPLETWRAVPVHEADPRDRQPTDPSERADASPPSEPAPAPRIPDRPNDAAPTAPVKAYVPAEPLSDNPTPEYPRLARRKGMEGVVLVRAHVSPTGSVLAVSVSRSSGHRSLDEAAVSCVRRWTFDPALDRGEPVEGLVEFPIRFRLKGGR